MKMQDMGRHPYSKIFGDMPEEEYEALKADIKENGFQNTVIWLYEGKVLDGWHRHKVAVEAGVDGLEYAEFRDGSPLEFVASVNIHRRHLTPAQRAVIVVKHTDMMKHGDVKTQKDDRPHGLSQPQTEKQTADMAGVGIGTIKRTKQALDHATEEQVEDMIAGKTTPTEILRTVNREERNKQLSAKETVLPTGEQRFSVVYADPPWKLEFQPSESRAVENHYPTMELDDIKNMEVEKICHEDSVLYLWATAPKLPQAFEVMDEWGFKYVTSMVWVKDKIGLGYWARNKHELLLIGTRGSFPAPDPTKLVASVIEAPRTRHSEKPVEFAEMIETLFVDHAKIELFCRTPREGWSVWGNESSPLPLDAERGRVAITG